jgi:DNA-binding NarL/FixJ family response regulator
MSLSTMEMLAGLASVTEERGPEPPCQPPSSRCCIVYADPRPLSRDTMCQWLQTRMGGFTTCAVPSVDEALALAERRSDVAVILHSFGSQRCETPEVADTLERLVRNKTQAPVAVLAETDEASAVMAALRCGAHGYIPTSLASSVVVQALHLVCAGDIYAPTRSLLRQAGWQDGPGNGAKPPASLDGFSPRQLQIVECLRRGLANKQIAYELGMSQGTVKVHVRNIMKKLQATNRTQVVLMTMPNGAG